jgi:hypothetical protein
VPWTLAVRAELAHLLREIGVGRHDSAAVAERAEVLRGIEREAAGDAERAGRAAVDPEAVRLRCVFDHRQAELEQLRDRRRASIEVDGNDGRRLWAGCACCLPGNDRE